MSGKVSGLRMGGNRAGPGGFQLAVEKKKKEKRKRGERGPDAGPSVHGRRGPRPCTRTGRLPPAIQRCGRSGRKRRRPGDLPAAGGDGEGLGGVAATWGCPGAAWRCPFPPAASSPASFSPQRRPGERRRRWTPAFLGSTEGLVRPGRTWQPQWNREGGEKGPGAILLHPSPSR
jgi:hypothetical protein